MILSHTNKVKNNKSSLAEVLYQGKQWCVTTYGLEKRDGSYYIEAKELKKSHVYEFGWIKHMSLKADTDMEDFTAAYIMSLAIHQPSFLKHGTALDLICQLEQARRDRQKWGLKTTQMTLELPVVTLELP